jgi:predicted HTH domain antitoxin
MSDIINLFGGNVAMAKKAADIALLSTDLGRGGVVKAQLSNVNGQQTIKYIMTATGQEYDSAEDAFVAASTLRVTQFERIVPSSGKVGDIANNPRRAQMGSIMESMQNEFNLRMGNSQMFRDFIQNITGQTGTSLNLSMDVISTSSKRGGDVKEFLDLAKKELGGYIPFASDEGVDILQFAINNKKLTTSETHLLLSFLGNDILNPAKVVAGFGAGGTANKLEDFLSKIPKRARAFTSERDITLQLSDLVQYMDRKYYKPGASVTDEMGVVIQEGLDVLRSHNDKSLKGIKGSKKLKVRARDQYVYRVMQNVDTQAIISSSMERALIGIDDDIAKDAMRNKLNSYLQSDDFRNALRNSGTNKDLQDFYRSANIDDDIKGFLDDIMDTSEKEFDGRAVLNKKAIDGAKKTLKARISQIKSDIQNGVGDIADNQKALQQLQGQLDIVSNATNLYQVTGRGQLGPDSIKTAFDIRALSGNMQNILFVMGSSQLKKDVNLATGTNMITLSGFGSPKERVYADPVTLAFHPEAFSTEADILNYKNYAAGISQQFQEAVESNILPKKIETMLQNVVDEDISMLPVTSQASRGRYKELARKTLELHQSGIGPKNSPLMMNMLHSMFQTEAFKVVTKGDKEFFMPVMPDVNRFALATESTEAMAGGRSILGKYTTASGRGGMSDITFDLANGTRVNQELAKFRVSNGTVLFHAGAVKEYFNALGGFDLDDKGLPKLMTASYTDDTGKQVKDLMFAMVRQPSGPQEIMYTSAALDDVETLRHFFGEESFIAELEQIRGTSDAAEELHNILTNKKRRSISGNLTERDMKDVIIDVYDSLSSKGKASITQASDRLLENVAQYGSSPLRNTNLTTRFGLERVLKSSEDIANTEYQEFMRKKLQQILPDFKNQIDQQTYSDIMRATTPQQIGNIISNFDESKNIGLKAAMNQSVSAFMAERATADADILGVYVNRSMVVGSSLNQIEDFAKRLDSAKIAQLQKYNIGLTLQETAIDRAVTFSAQADFLAEVSRTSATLDPTTGRIFVENILKEKLGQVTMDQVGLNAMENLGKMMGGMTAMFYGENMADQDLFPVIDQILLETRMTTEGDVQKLLSGMISGIKDVSKEFGYQDQRIEDLLSEMTKASVSKERGIQFLTERFAAQASHRYASTARAVEAAAKVNAEMDALARLAFAGVVPDQILMSTSVSQEASNVADYLLDRNAKMLDELFSKSAKEMGDTEREKFAIQKFYQSQRVSAELSEASRLSGRSQEEILNAMEKRAAQRGIKFRSFEKLDFADDQGRSFYQKLLYARTRRQRQFYQRALSQDQLTSFENVANMIDAGVTAGADPYTMANAGVTSITQDDLDLLDEIESGKGSENNSIIRNINAEKKLDQQVVDEISTATSAQVVDLKDDTFNKGIQAAIDGDEYSRYLPGNTPYKRFTNFVKDGELKNLFTENATFRRSIYAVGALVAGSFFYSAVKDHTAEKIQGPPLLPGGSAYEQQYPNRASEIPQIGTVNYNPGVSYKVNLYGNRQDVDSFRSMAMELGNFDMNTTMYSGIPDVGKDPYAEMASAY